MLIKEKEKEGEEKEGEGKKNWLFVFDKIVNKVNSYPPKLDQIPINPDKSCFNLQYIINWQIRIY